MKTAMQANGLGNTFLNEEILQQRAAQRGLILSRPGEQPEVRVRYASEPASDASARITTRQELRQAHALLRNQIRKMSI